MKNIRAIEVINLVDEVIHVANGDERRIKEFIDSIKENNIGFMALVLIKYYLVKTVPASIVARIRQEPLSKATAK